MFGFSSGFGIWARAQHQGRDQGRDRIRDRTRIQERGREQDLSFLLGLDIHWIDRRPLPEKSFPVGNWFPNLNPAAGTEGSFRPEAWMGIIPGIMAIFRALFRE